MKFPPTTTELKGLKLNSVSAGTLLGKSYIYDYEGKVFQVSKTVGSTFGAEYSAISPYDGLNVSECHDSCREEEGSGSPYPRNACECSNNVFYAEQELGIDCNLSRILYYYHPDYLGHNEYITDITGRPYPYFHYSAFGESLIEKNTNFGQFSSPYRFNGKELDPETGNYYYGARYYNPTWSVWLSVDPLAGKFPSLMPYHYTTNNPVNIIDPDGRDTSFADNNARNLFLSAYNRVNSMVEKGEKKLKRVVGDAMDENGKIDYGALSEKQLEKAADVATKYSEWNKLKSDFDNILDHKEKVTYSVDPSNLKGDNGLTTKKDGNLKVILAGNIINTNYNESTVIHENRHVNQFLDNQPTELMSELDAYAAQRVYSPGYVSDFIRDHGAKNLRQAIEIAYPELKR